MDGYREWKPEQKLEEQYYKENQRENELWIT